MSPVLKAAFAEQWMNPTGRLDLADKYNPLFEFLGRRRCVPTYSQATQAEAYIALAGLLGEAVTQFAFLDPKQLIARFHEPPWDVDSCDALFADWAELLQGSGAKHTGTYVTHLLKARSSAWDWTSELKHLPISNLDWLLWLTLSYHEIGEMDTADRFQKLLFLIPKALFLGLAQNGTEAIFLSLPPRK